MKWVCAKITVKGRATFVGLVSEIINKNIGILKISLKKNVSIEAHYVKEMNDTLHNYVK